MRIPQNSPGQIVASTALFGPPPLFDEEDTKVYDQLLTQVFTTVTPADIFEHIWVRDVVDLSIEVLRLRRFKVKLATHIKA